MLRRCRSKADRAAEPLARAVLRPKLTLVWGCLLVNERTALLARRAWRASTAAVHPYLTRVVPHGGTESAVPVWELIIKTASSELPLQLISGIKKTETARSVPLF